MEQKSKIVREKKQIWLTANKFTSVKITTFTVYCFKFQIRYFYINQVSDENQ